MAGEGGDKGVHTFPKDISPKMNVIAWLEFELIYFEVAVQHFNHYATGTPPLTLFGSSSEISFPQWESSSLILIC